MRHLRLVASILVFILAVVAPALSRAAETAGQPATFSIPEGSQSLAVLDGQWRFHPGDDPQWAKPNFDDSTWALLRSDEGWSPARYPKLEGFAWYRFRVHVPANAGPLAIELPPIYTSYQLFADGVFVGSPSKLPLDQQVFRIRRAVYALPNTSSAHDISFALRMWHWHVWASYYPGGAYGHTRIGSEATVNRDARLITGADAWNGVDRVLLAVLEALAGLIALVLFFLQTRERAYLWFGLTLIFSAAERCWAIWSINHVFWVTAGDNIDATLASLSLLSSAFFYKDFLNARNGPFFKVVLASLVANLLMGYAGLVAILSVPVATLIGILLTAPFSCWLIFILLRSVRRKIAEARLLIVPVFFIQAVGLGFSLLWLMYTIGWQHQIAAEDYTLGSWPFTITVQDISSVLFLLSVLAVLMIRFSRVLREQDRIHTDLHAARTLQQMLIPEEVPETPGWAITTAYHPAQEVGGDFFQIVQVPSPLPDSPPDTIVLLGDAAGKGLPAAMTVSMLLGAFRTLVESTSSPAVILGGLNRRLNARGAGFTTAVALRLTASGELTLASAGHLSPYLNGDELAVPPALPLGMDPEETVVEAKWQLEPGDRITLMTDGVPEARKHHELFGFERTKNLSTAPAHDIAEAALRFGQEDDVTVLSLVLV